MWQVFESFYFAVPCPPFDIPQAIVFESPENASEWQEAIAQCEDGFKWSDNIEGARPFVCSAGQWSPSPDTVACGMYCTCTVYIHVHVHVP